MMSQPSATRSSQLASDLELLTPALKAYLFGLLSVTVPRAASLLIAVARGKSRLDDALRRVFDLVRRQATLDRFPFTCSLLVFGATWIPRLLLRLLTRASPSAASRSQTRRRAAFLTFLGSFAAGLASFRLLNKRPSNEERFVDGALSTSRRVTDAHLIAADSARPHQADVVETAARRQVGATAMIELAGRTLDLTFFGAVRALDIVVALAWSRSRSSVPEGVSKVVESTTVPALFALSSSIVMWAWFYVPHALPSSYRAWISSAAQIDLRLVQALREIRYGTFIYGQDTGRAALLGDMCLDLGFPPAWGDPAATVPIPCELYHSGTGKNCEWHGAVRFGRAWSFAMRMYLPLNLALLLRRKVTAASVRNALVEASRSAAFLGAFVSLFYYGVCLGRTRIGPRLMEDSIETSQRLEGGPNVATGCALCGWSILLEKAARQQEMAFFVAPRALATVFPRRYDRKVSLRELNNEATAMRSR